jgi:hypothetical protein
MALIYPLTAMSLTAVGQLSRASATTAASVFRPFAKAPGRGVCGSIKEAGLLSKTLKDSLLTQDCCQSVYSSTAISSSLGITIGSVWKELENVVLNLVRAGWQLGSLN